jgi:hypothetical protein
MACHWFATGGPRGGWWWCKLRRVKDRQSGYKVIISATQQVKSEPGPPITLGGAAGARVRLIVWCKECQRQVEPDPAEMAATAPKRPCSAGGARLVCSRRGSRQVGMVVTGDNEETPAGDTGAS